MNNCCGGCKRGLCAKDISIFSSLDSSELTEIIEKMNHKRVNKNDVIFLEFIMPPKKIIICFEF